MEPITILEDGRYRRTIADIEDALRWLHERWPGVDKTSAKYDMALAMAVAALEGQVSATAARRWLLAYARDEYILA